MSHILTIGLGTIQGGRSSLVRNGYSRYLIAKKVRALAAQGLNGLQMPGFAKDRISERELLNVVSYVYQM
jgi:mono/diheme cytochrome c family protein